MLDSAWTGGAEVPIKFQFSFDRNVLAYLRSAVLQWAGECYSLRGGRILVTMWGELWLVPQIG